VSTVSQPDETPLSATEQEVRRLLASARHTEPVPPEVATRLDGVLAGLAAAEESPAPPPAPVTDLDVHRRRRRVAQLLVAAAAVVVVGVGVGQVLERGSGGSADSTAGAADSSLEREQAPADAPQAQGDSAGGGKEQDGILNGAAADLATIDPQQFDRDVGALRSLSYAASPDSSRTTPKSRVAATAVACRSAAWGAGTFVPVSYGGAPGVLVLRRPQGDTQVADLFLCGETVPTRSVVLPAP
jgi:hypothetical protein